MLRIAQNDSICAQNRLKLPDIASIPLDSSILEAFKCMKCIIRRHGPTNMSTLLSTVSGFVVNLQHQQLVELESIYPVILTPRSRLAVSVPCTQSAFGAARGFGCGTGLLSRLGPVPAAAPCATARRYGAPRLTTGLPFPAQVLPRHCNRGQYTSCSRKARLVCSGSEVANWSGVCTSAMLG